MKLYATKASTNRPRHAAGEIVWATVGNYIENPDAMHKLRPVVILRAGSCQHWTAGLTTQAAFKTTGEARVALPDQWSCGLYGTSYLWSRRPSWSRTSLRTRSGGSKRPERNTAEGRRLVKKLNNLCRLDARWHAGWIDAATLAVIEEYMHMPWHVLAELRAAVREMTYTAGMVPAAIHG